MSVPLLDLKAQHLPLEPELTAAFTRVLRSGQYILGPEVEGCERAFANYLKVKHAITVSSGTDALLAALMAFEIGPGDEVLCPAFTFFATAGCVARLGAKPVFVDSCPACFNIDPHDAARKITRRTKAVIPVHLFGQPAALDPVLALAGTHGLPVIEDAAQAIGARYQGRFAGTAGAFGAFSFFPTKNLGCLGDGGLLVTNDDALAERAILLRNHGAKPKYFHKFVGGNFRMDALQAAILRVKLPRLPQYHDMRRLNAAYYTDHLGKLPGIAVQSPDNCWCEQTGSSDVREETLPSDANVILPVAQPRNDPVWNQYTLRIRGTGRRDELRQFLTDRGIGTEVYYPVPLHKQECFAGLNPVDFSLPVAEQLSRESLSLPIYPELSHAQLDEVIGVISQFLQS